MLRGRQITLQGSQREVVNPYEKIRSEMLQYAMLDCVSLPMQMRPLFDQTVLEKSRTETASRCLGVLFENMDAFEEC